ncbi:uncharacterized protein CC84DRAFT_1169053 [Paraphaeosphaeria sporulosa]|uniref:Uncharacterized protein n=1 Tax=Paraphaeosphaeria sporulosa TaxID=1460663 RepID=A0A177BXI3_9PLEO|nr:uncharacterized protein CC84DRAFT_1169053 [Paraphaeosphaeria sporulosa]OAG00224.1 hypothetical protein CC84DRAFT_1169053 [Paraphaeosphaeria sporulosa]
MGFKDSIRACGLLTIDLHRMDEFTGLTQCAVSEHESLQEDEDNINVPWQSQKWDFFGRSRTIDG